MGDLDNTCIGALDKGERKICKDDCVSKLTLSLLGVSNLESRKLTPLLNIAPQKVAHGKNLP
jgi:hypothetical protein